MVLWTWLCLSAKGLHQNQKLYVNHSIAAECRLGLSTHILPHYEFVAAFTIHCPMYMCAASFTITISFPFPFLLHYHHHCIHITFPLHSHFHYIPISVTFPFPLPLHSHFHYLPIPIAITFPLPLPSHCITITIDRYHTLSHDLLLLCFEYTYSLFYSRSFRHINCIKMAVELPAVHSCLLLYTNWTISFKVVCHVG